MDISDIKIKTDRVVDSTDNNEFARDLRDETALPEELLEQPTVDEQLSDALDEPHSDNRPLYTE